MNHRTFSFSLLLLAVASTPALAQGVAKTQGNPYETCIAAEVAKSGGSMLAEAKARSVCRERYPNQAAESNRRPLTAAAGVPASGPAASASGSAVPGTSAGTSGGGTAGGGTASPSAAPAPAPAPASAPTPVSTPSPIATPGVGGGNPHGAPPGQAKK